MIDNIWKTEVVEWKDPNLWRKSESIKESINFALDNTFCDLYEEYVNNRWTIHWMLKKICVIEYVLGKKYGITSYNANGFDIKPNKDGSFFCEKRLKTIYPHIKNGEIMFYLWPENAIQQEPERVAWNNAGMSEPER